MTNRVVVTGYGVLTPLGLSPENLWDNLLDGKSGVGEITKFDASDYAVRIAAEVKDFDSSEYLDKKEARRMDPCSQYAMAAAMEAVEYSELNVSDVPSERMGVVIGTGQGGITSLSDQMETFLERGPRRVSPFCIPMMISNMPAGHVSLHFGAKGPNVTLTTACAASAHAIGEAFRVLQRDEADVVLTGGTESGIVPISLAGFTSMRALSTNNDDPEGACKPFDAERDGFVLGEGSAILILETLDHAKKRGANILGELVGYAATSDAHHITAPPPDGEGGARSMSNALADAEMQPEEIDYINAHGTGTPTGDMAESRAIENVFGDGAFDIPVTSTKSMTGHQLGAAGAVESVISLEVIQNDVIPPTINLSNPGEACRLDYVPSQARESRVNVVLSNSFGFGGQNATLIWKGLE